MFPDGLDQKLQNTVPFTGMVYADGQLGLLFCKVGLERNAVTVWARVLEWMCRYRCVLELLVESEAKM
jgi:hypothetical protein